MDVADQSFDEEQAYIADRIRKSTKRVSKVKPVGYCHCCFEDLPEDKLFCNDKCATIYETTEKLNMK